MTNPEATNHAAVIRAALDFASSDRGLAALNALLAERDAAVTERDEAVKEARAAVPLINRQRERAEAAEAERDTARKGNCNVCWSRSWSPCPEETPNAVKNPDLPGWMVCDLCAAEATLTRYRNALEQIAANGNDEPFDPKRPYYAEVKAIARAALDGPKEEQ